MSAGSHAAPRFLADAPRSLHTLPHTPDPIPPTTAPPGPPASALGGPCSLCQTGEGCFVPWTFLDVEIWYLQRKAESALKTNAEPRPAAKVPLGTPGVACPAPFSGSSWGTRAPADPACPCRPWAASTSPPSPPPAPDARGLQASAPPPEGAMWHRARPPWSLCRHTVRASLTESRRPAFRSESQPGGGSTGVLRCTPLPWR